VLRMALCCARREGCLGFTLSGLGFSASLFQPLGRTVQDKRARGGRLYSSSCLQGQDSNGGGGTLFYSMSQSRVCALPFIQENNRVSPPALLARHGNQNAPMLLGQMLLRAL
jgi:hypothetical protein